MPEQIVEVRIPRDQHVVRWCAGSKVDNGVVQPGAFARRASDARLSVSCLEMATGHTEPERLREILELLGRDGITIKPSATGKAAVLLVGDVEEIEAKPPLEVFHERNDRNHAHCGISNVPIEDGEGGALYGLSILEDLCEAVLYAYTPREIASL